MDNYGNQIRTVSDLLGERASPLTAFSMTRHSTVGILSADTPAEEKGENVWITIAFAFCNSQPTPSSSSRPPSPVLSGCFWFLLGCETHNPKKHSICLIRFCFVFGLCSFNMFCFRVVLLQDVLGGCAPSRWCPPFEL